MMNLGVLFSGGKDSVYATYLASQHETVSCLIAIRSKNEESYMFHTPNIDATALQAEAMDIPYISWDTEGKKEDELSDLADAISYAREKYGIEGIVTGAIESVYQASRVQRICRDMGLWCFNPLWQTDQVDYLIRLLNDGFETLIVGVFAYPLKRSWIGRRIDAECINELVSLKERYKINPSGEGGELETFVVDGPLFNKRIDILSSHSSYENYSGTLTIEKMGLAEK